MSGEGRAPPSPRGSNPRFRTIWRMDSSPHKAARLTSRATREGFESPRVWVGFPTGCASNNSPGGEPELFLYGRLSAVWSAARVCRHGWFNSKGGFLYSRSSIGRALVSKTKGCRLGPCRECHFACPMRGPRNSGASGRESSGCSSAHRLTPVQRTECTGAAYMPS